MAEIESKDLPTRWEVELEYLNYLALNRYLEDENEEFRKQIKGMDITSTLMNDMVDRWKDIPQLVNGEGKQKTKDNENKNEETGDKRKENINESQVLSENGSKGLATVKAPNEPKELHGNVDPSPGTRHSRSQSPMNESPTSEQA
ncbi:hypothetical protein LJB42_004437 [Komagataella kurtzmanii]|nr:hypothetical protein LJB42_004437 [Komagataella kurtzmanii]